ncbi:hypothetical protein CesoFtcFv8_020530 [Champsocephalus esox]|uniref:Uncharacterized protein n=1 Tax=Champsocephalus esox TaxID=159716 RepID=A0AAN8BBB4_9TELE|nr:hypothetical protein CesoFtcFv8_020530 [Champsocephalus esox]
MAGLGESCSHVGALLFKHIYPQLAGTTIPDTELELQESTDSVSDTEQELQNNYVVSTVIPGRRAEQ